MQPAQSSGCLNVSAAEPWPDAGGSWWWPESLTLTRSGHLTSEMSSLSFVTLHVFYISLPLASPRALHVINNQRMMTRGGKMASHWPRLDLAALLLSQSPLDGGLVRPRGGHTQHQQLSSMSARCIVLFSWYLTRKGSRRTRNARGGCKVWRLRFPLSWLLYGKIFCWRRKCGCWCDGLYSAAQVHSAPGHCDDPGGFLHRPGQQLPFKWRGEQLGLNLL